MQAEHASKAMARLPQALAQGADPPGPPPQCKPAEAHPATPKSAPTDYPPAPRLAHVLLNTFPAQHPLPSAPLIAADSTGRTAVANNPRVAPYASLPSLSTLCTGPASNGAPHHCSAQQADRLTGLQQQLGDSQHQPSAYPCQQGITKNTVPGKPDRNVRRPVGKGKRSELKDANRTSSLQPKSAGIGCLIQDAGVGFNCPDAKSATANRLKKKQARARSVSPNSQYHFSCTSSVPDDAAAWIAATTDAASRPARFVQFQCLSCFL